MFSTDVSSSEDTRRQVSHGQTERMVRGNITRLKTRSSVLPEDSTFPEGAALGNFNRGSDASNLTLARLFKTRPCLR